VGSTRQWQRRAGAVTGDDTDRAGPQVRRQPREHARRAAGWWVQPSRERKGGREAWEVGSGVGRKAEREGATGYFSFFFFYSEI
jgi:hypothetical protein